MNVKLHERLAELSTLRAAALRAKWRRVVGDDPPPAFKTDLIARGIAHKLQEKAQGGLSRAHQRLIMAEVAALNSGQPARRVIAPKSGTRLSRAWHGEVHHVLVLNKGYEYRDQRYASLSSIAKLITGATWSGPRFFGLNSIKGANLDA
jgi:Protein of unknown function (DUF2924)